MLPRDALWVMAALAAAAGCDRPPPADERTLQRLAEEAARQRQRAETERLAEVAVTPPAQTRKTLPVPKQPRLVAGPLQMEVVALTLSQVVEGEKVSLGTEDRFLRVQLEVRNSGSREASADLSQAVLVGAGKRTWGIARDVQRLAGTRVLQAGLAPGESRDFVMFFEVPEAALSSGLSLSVPEAGRNGDGVISLD